MNFKKNVNGYWLVENGRISMILRTGGGKATVETGPKWQKFGAEVVDYFYDRLPADSRKAAH
jgi:hypothetical protein